MIFDHPLISQRYFFPRAHSVETPLHIQCDDVVLKCFASEHKVTGPTMLHFHGNGEIVADYAGTIDQAFSQCGVNTIFAEYRGFGGSNGFPEMGKMLEDTETIIQTLELDPTDLFVFGRSVGSIYAIEVARRHPDIKGLIIESGISNPLQRILMRMSPEELGCSEDELIQAANTHLNHERALKNYPGPLLLIHTRHDGIVDLDHAEQNYEWANSDSKKLRIFERGNHNSIMGENWNEYFKEVADFVSAQKS